MSRVRVIALAALAAFCLDWATKLAALWWMDGWITNPDRLSLWALAVIAALVGMCTLLLGGRLIALAGGIALGSSAGNIVESALLGPVIDWLPCGWTGVLEAGSMCNAADAGLALSGLLLVIIGAGVIVRPRRMMHPALVRLADRLSGAAPDEPVP